MQGTVKYDWLADFHVIYPSTCWIATSYLSPCVTLTSERFTRLVGADKVIFRAASLSQSEFQFVYDMTFSIICILVVVNSV